MIDLTSLFVIPTFLPVRHRKHLLVRTISHLCAQLAAETSLTYVPHQPVKDRSLILRYIIGRYVKDYPQQIVSSHCQKYTLKASSASFLSASKSSNLAFNFSSDSSILLS